MKKEIHCNRCHGEINPRESFVVTIDLLKVVTYHNDCYANELKTQKSFFLDKPINTNISTFSVVLFDIVVPLILLFARPGLVYSMGLLTLGAIATGYRLYSWFKYEK